MLPIDVADWILLMIVLMAPMGYNMPSMRVALLVLIVLRVLSLPIVIFEDAAGTD